MSGSLNMRKLEEERGKREHPEKAYRFIKVTTWPNRAERRQRKKAGAE